MSYFSADVEMDAKTPASGSMVCFGVVLARDTDVSFYGQTRPIKDTYEEERLAISGFTREEHEQFDDPEEVMRLFAEWVKINTKGRPIFISDNNGADFAWINYYFDLYDIENPFGWSSRRIGDLYCGMKMDVFAKWKWLRKTVHDHNPVNDAKGNVEALVKMKEMGLKIKL